MNSSLFDLWQRHGATRAGADAIEQLVLQHAGVELAQRPVLLVQAGPAGTWVEPPDSIADAYRRAVGALAEFGEDAPSDAAATAVHRGIVYEVFYDVRQDGMFLRLATQRPVRTPDRPVPFWEARLPEKEFESAIDLTADPRTIPFLDQQLVPQDAPTSPEQRSKGGPRRPVLPLFRRRR